MLPIPNLPEAVLTFGQDPTRGKSVTSGSQHSQVLSVDLQRCRSMSLRGWDIDSVTNVQNHVEMVTAEDKVAASR